MHMFNSTGVSLYEDDIADSDGCYVIDRNGNKYLDLESGVWCLPLGHKHPRITKVMKEQMDKISHVNYRYNHNIAEKAAGKLIEVTEMNNGRCIFLSSGSEAVDLGIKIARTLRPGKTCMCLSDQYFSAYGFGADTDQNNWMKIPWIYEDHKSEEDWLQIISKIKFDEVGVFVFEPGNSAGLVRLPPPILVNLIVKKMEEVHGIIVVDEVTSGIGRTGKWFGYMHYGLSPDIIAIGKGLGNGYPVSAVVFQEEIADELIKIKFRYAQSHQNDPLGCRIAYEVLTIMEETHLIDHVNHLGCYVRHECSQLVREHTLLKEVRGVGLMNCIQFTDTISSQDMIEIEKHFFDKNMIVGVHPKAKCLRIYMPFIIRKEMIDLFVKELEYISYRP